MADDDKVVPDIDADMQRLSGGSQFEQAEARLLELSADIQGLQIKEAKQRITFRWLAIVMAVLVILFMGGML